jgi:hypothetical protein
VSEVRDTSEPDDKVNIHSQPHRLIAIAEDRAWLDADLSRLGDYEQYDWGPQGVPKGQPMRRRRWLRGGGQ